jgi:predicted Zn-dependent protease
MWNAAWETLEDLPSELKQDLGVLHWRIQIQMGMGEYEKASYIGLSLVEQFPEKLGILLATAECLIKTKDYEGACGLLRKGLTKLSENPDLWLTLARVEALLGDTEAARDCVKRYVTLNPEGKADLLSINELDPLW